MSALLFDMDGTVIDSEPLWLQAEIEVMGALGLHWDASDQLNCLGGPMDRTERYMQERSGHIKPFGYFRDQLNLAMKSKLRQDLKLIPNALTLISQARENGIKTALVTASGKELMNIALEKFPADCFDVAISRDDVIKTKPDPEPYLKAAKVLDVDIDKCVIFEDSQTGINSALSSGGKVIAISHTSNLNSHDNLRVVKNLSEISLKMLIHWYPSLFKLGTK